MQTLARQGYTAEQTAAVLKAGTGRIGNRFELLDPAFRVVGNFDAVTPGTTNATAPGSILAAQVDYDVDRPLVGSLDLKMLPDDRLRNAPFQYRIKPYISFGPTLDGRTVEFPMGVYIWDVPERDLAPGVEEWNVTLADGLFDLDSDGPPVGGFNVWKGELQTDAIARIVQSAGLIDTSGVQPSGAVFAGPRTWGMTRPAAGWGFTYLPGFTEGWGFYSDGRTISVGGDNPNQTRTSTWRDIASAIHNGIGYQVPWCNFEGVYQARPYVDWTKATSAVQFGTASDGITISPIHSTHDVSKRCNYAAVWSESGDVALFFAEADANTIAPGHPLSQANIRHYLRKFDTRSTANSDVTAQLLARKMVLEGLVSYRRVSFRTLFWPVEPFDVISVMVAGDAEYATPQLFQSRSARFDLFTGVIEHEANQVFASSSTGAIA